MTTPPNKAEEIAKQLCTGITEINVHLGYPFTQPLMKLKADIAAALQAHASQKVREALDAIQYFKDHEHDEKRGDALRLLWRVLEEGKGK